MPYREEVQATRDRAEALQREVELARRELAQLQGERAEAARLRKRLRAAERKLAVLSGERRPRWPLIVVGVIAVGGAVAGALYQQGARPRPASRPAAVLPVGVAALAEVGVGVEAIATLRSLKPRQPEVDELAAAKRAGASDETCVELLRAARARKRQLHQTRATASLLGAGVSQATIVALARLGQLGWHSDVVKMRRAGVADPAILQLARLRSLVQLSVSGADVARLRRAGVGDEALVRLANRGVSGDAIDGLVAQRQRGLSDAEIVARFNRAGAAEAPAKQAPVK